MIEPASVVEYGAAIVAIIAMCWIVKVFMAYVKEQKDDFKNTIDNHLKDEAEKSVKLADAIKGLGDVIKNINSKNK